MHSARLILCALAATVAPLTAGTDPIAATAKTDQWQFRTVPYLWLTASSGDLFFLERSEEISQSFADTFDTHNLSLHLLAEARKGPWIIQSDIIYGRFNNDTQLLPHSHGPFKSVREDLKEWIISPRIGYSILATPDHQLDLLAGVRYSRFRLGLTGRFTSGGQVTEETLQNIWDPTLTVSGQSSLHDKLFIRYLGEVGGFGVNSDFIWLAGVGFGYQLSPTSSIIGGYRARGIDFSDSDFAVDTVTHGPTLEFEMRF
ncbi:hypothetical protein [Sulfuriroseicoccus oceanibius]|uniref:Outer membrane protein beta-barrel domain-containing protein n=1 Tax=Sulfuriroseicoccus oceanibius TaxID=2707525 RepID=A0A6B3LCC4_9BACT|nr:hypothetical protein [Sulfuriroseicoccus oceanibius]QQL45092.1 hypothetical protein G3M56_000450 [Sulfuriroseicoccus oceanibius]